MSVIEILNKLDSCYELEGDKVRAKICKEDQEWQIINCVVHDPYTIDTDTDWLPAAEIEKMAFNFMVQSRTVGFRHKSVVKEAHIVENFLVPYPTVEDRANALLNKDHSAYKMPYGNDVVGSGAWITGIMLPDDMWALYKSGEFEGVSLGGTGERKKVDIGLMPKIHYIQL